MTFEVIHIVNNGDMKQTKCGKRTFLNNYMKLMTEEQAKYIKFMPNNVCIYCWKTIRSIEH